MHMYVIEQVTSVSTTDEALGLLDQHGLQEQPAFDLILKEHAPPKSDACRLLRKMAKMEGRINIPVVGERCDRLRAFDSAFRCRGALGGCRPPHVLLYYCQRLDAGAGAFC